MGFGYSDDNFEDYSWFRNCIDNCGGDSGSGSYSGSDNYQPTEFDKKYGWKLALAAIIFAVLIIAIDIITDGAISSFVNGY